MSTRIPAYLSAAQVRTHLERLGFAPGKATEGDDCVDGEVRLPGRVYVQVPTFGGPLIVGRSYGSGARFRIRHWPARTTWEVLAADIRDALGALRAVAS